MYFLVFKSDYMSEYVAMLTDGSHIISDGAYVCLVAITPKYPQVFYNTKSNPSH